MAARQFFSTDQVEQLRAMLSAPPSPPKPTGVVGVRNLLHTLKPQLRALVRAGYEHEQIAGFFRDRGIDLPPVQIKLVAGSGRASRPARRGKAPAQ